MPPLPKANFAPLTAEEEQFGLPPYRRWYCFGLRSPRVLYFRLHNKYQPIFRLRMAWQRARRGHSDDQLWNLNFALAQLTVAGVKAMRLAGNGYPAEFSEEYGEGGGWEKWDSILARIEDGFQAWLDEDGWLLNNPEAEAKFKDAMNLYVHWFESLWD